MNTLLLAAPGLRPSTPGTGRGLQCRVPQAPARAGWP